MKKLKTTVVLLSCALTISACSSFNTAVDKNDYEQIAERLSDFSKKINAFYENSDPNCMTGCIPNGFGKNEFFETLKNVYPDNDVVEFVKDNFKIIVSSRGGYYAVEVCDPKTENIIMVDFSCDERRVEVRSWQETKKYPCTNGIDIRDWEEYCK